MSAVPGIQAALFGIQKHLEQFERTAGRLARQAPDGDLAHDMVELLTAKHGVQANAATVRAADELTGTLLDVLR